jgi:hypothetical protein
MFVSKNFGELLYPCGNPTVKTLTKISGESWQLVTAIPDEGDAHNTQSVMTTLIWLFCLHSVAEFPLQFHRYTGLLSLLYVNAVLMAKILRYEVYFSFIAGLPSITFVSFCQKR